jgi:acetyl esterase/lipase
MLRRGFLSALFALAAWSAAAAAGKPVPPTLDQDVVFPGGVTAARDLTYAAIGGFRPLTLDLYQTPSKPKDPPRPVILFVHGGGWDSGDARHLNGFADFPATLAALAAKGNVVASVNYRLSGEAHFPAPVQDVKSALRWLRGHAADYNIDTTRMMAWGAEAGGQIAALVGTSCGVATLEPAADAKSKARLASDCVEGVIDWYGPADLASWDTGAAHPAEAGAPTRLGAYLGCEPADCAAGVVRTASPLSYIESTSPPFLIQHGAADTLVPPDQSQKLYDALRAQSAPAEILIYPGTGQDFAKDGAPDPAASAKAITDMEDFIAKTFPPPPKQAAATSSAKRSANAAKAAKPKPTRTDAKNKARK